MSNKTNTNITPLQAIKRMRELTAAGVTFSFECYGYNSTKRESSGYKVVAKALLRLGYRDDQSNKADVLIAYTNHADGGVPRFFYLPLLMKFNGYTIKP